MRAWANLYPWDVDGDPAAPDRIAGLGLTGVTLAAAYHAVRAVTPFHPRHRIVTRDAAVYYRTGPSRWRAVPSGQQAGPPGQQAGAPDQVAAASGRQAGRSRPARLRPVVARPAGSFERAAAALRARGLAVTAWAVITHNDRLGAAVTVTGTVQVGPDDASPYAVNLTAGTRAPRRPGQASLHPDLSLRARR